MSQKSRARRIRKVLELIRDSECITVGKALRELAVLGVSGKTLEDYIKSLNWGGLIKFNPEKIGWEITEKGLEYLRKHPEFF